MWLSENEGAKFWLGILTELKNRGLEDILIVCVDGLQDFPEAIQTVYSQTHIQSIWYATAWNLCRSAITRKWLVISNVFTSQQRKKKRFANLISLMKNGRPSTHKLAVLGDRTGTTSIWFLLIYKRFVRRSTPPTPLSLWTVWFVKQSRNVNCSRMTIQLRR